MKTLLEMINYVLDLIDKYCENCNENCSNCEIHKAKKVLLRMALKVLRNEGG